MRKQRQVINPLAMLAARQKLTPEIVDEYALPAWLYLDAVLRLRVSTWDSLLPQIDLGLLVGAVERWQQVSSAFGIDEAAHA